MNDNIIWVDFRHKVKRKNKHNIILINLTNVLKKIFHTSSKYYNPNNSKPILSYHKSIL